MANRSRFTALLQLILHLARRIVEVLPENARFRSTHFPFSGSSHEWANRRGLSTFLLRPANLRDLSLTGNQLAQRNPLQSRLVVFDAALS
jgi:hypothetical protein